MEGDKQTRFGETYVLLRKTSRRFKGESSSLPMLLIDTEYYKLLKKDSILIHFSHLL